MKTFFKGKNKQKTVPRIIKKIETLEITKEIKVSPHANFRVDEAQRKIYKEETLIDTLKNEKPEIIALQENGAYSAFYKRKNGYLRLIFKIYTDNIEIITFYNTDHIPKI